MKKSILMLPIISGLLLSSCSGYSDKDVTLFFDEINETMNSSNKYMRRSVNQNSSICSIYTQDKVFVVNETYGLTTNYFVGSKLEDGKYSTDVYTSNLDNGSGLKYLRTDVDSKDDSILFMLSIIGSNSYSKDIYHSFESFGDEKIKTLKCKNDEENNCVIALSNDSFSLNIYELGKDGILVSTSLTFTKFNDSYNLTIPSIFEEVKDEVIGQ